MPALGMAQETGKVLRWLRAEGDTVAEGEPLLEIETDKVTVEIESPAAGTLAAVCAAEGDEVPVGQAIAYVLAAGETAPEPVAAATETATSPPAAVVTVEVVGDGAPPRRALASPKARRLAAAQGIDLGAVAGSGPGGSIVAADLETDTAEPTPTGAVWRVMAERTTASWQTVPHFYLRRTVDASGMQRRREEAGSGITHTDLLVQSAAEALRLHPLVNVTWHDGRVVPLADVNVAIAIATDAGLVAPVIHHADRLDLDEVASRRQELVAAAREGRLRPDDISGGTFTVSNLGMYGVDSFDAIVNAPQAAILAVGRIADRIVAVDRQPVVRPMLELTVSFDHRAVDGARGAEFLDTLARLLETGTSE